MVLGEYEKMSRTGRILLPKKKKKAVILCVCHYLLHTVALWVCFVYVCVVQ